MEAQRTREWYMSRWGKFNSSEIKDLMTKGKGEPFGKTAMAYFERIADERLIDTEAMMYGEEDTMLPTPWSIWKSIHGSVSRAMQLGIDNEDDARRHYTDLTGIVMNETTHFTHPDFHSLCASCDGITPDGRGILEIKTSENTVRYSRMKTADDLKDVNADYYWQVVAELAVTRAEWCDFVSYSPFKREGQRITILRISRHDVEAQIAELEERVALAEGIVTSLVYAYESGSGN